MPQSFSLLRKKSLLDPASREQVVACIRTAEARTTGEIRVYMESGCAYVDAMHRAVELFTKLGMHHTEHRNAVLVYMALADRQFAIYGDAAIYEAGGTALWEHAAATLQSHIRSGNVTEGLCACITGIGDALAQHFPPDASINKNELPDEIVFGK